MSARRTVRVFAPSRSPRATRRERDRIWLFARNSAAGRPRLARHSDKTPSSERDRPSPNSARKTARLKSGRRSSGTATASRAASSEFCGKGFGCCKGKSARRTETLHVAPHVASLGGKKIEGRGRPPLRRENRPEQEGPPAQTHALGFGQRPAARGGEIGIGAGEIIPEIKLGQAALLALAFRLLPCRLLPCRRKSS